MEGVKLELRKCLVLFGSLCDLPMLKQNSIFQMGRNDPIPLFARSFAK